MLHDFHAVFPVFIRRNYGGMIGQGNLGVRDDRGKEEGMGSIAESTPYPADGKGDFPQGRLHAAGMVSVADKAAAVAAGAFQLAYLDGIHGGIIKFL